VPQLSNLFPRATVLIGWYNSDRAFILVISLQALLFFGFSTPHLDAVPEYDFTWSGYPTKISI